MIVKYTLTDPVLAEVAVVTAAPGVLVIGERVRGIVVKWVFLRPYILLQVEVLIVGEVLIGGSIVA